MHNESGNLFIYSSFSAISLIIALILLKFLKYPEKQGGVKYSTVIPVLIFGAIIGAKIPVILSYGWHREFIWTGKSYYGAILGAFIAINVFKKIYKIKAAFGDRFIIPLCISAGIGKLGCFFYGCCGGTESQCIRLVKNSSGAFVHPVQIYESAFEFICALLFFLLYKKQKLTGSHFLLYTTAYMIFRFLIEFIRIEPHIIFGLTVYQIMSVIFVPVFTILIFRRIKNA